MGISLSCQRSLGDFHTRPHVVTGALNAVKQSRVQSLLIVQDPHLCGHSVHLWVLWLQTIFIISL